jgi:hypothetical protein
MTFLLIFTMPLHVNIKDLLNARSVESERLGLVTDKGLCSSTFFELHQKHVKIHPCLFFSFLYLR